MCIHTSLRVSLYLCLYLCLYLPSLIKEWRHG